MKKVVSTVNFIKSQALNHRQFQQFLEDVEAECGDLIYYCEVRWLSKGKTLKRFYDRRDEIATFMDMKGKIIPELSDNWVRDLAFLVDLTMHFNDLNTKLQGQGQFVHHLYSHVKTFHFPTLAGCGKSKCAPYADELISMNVNLITDFKILDHKRVVCIRFHHHLMRILNRLQKNSKWN